MVTIKLITDNTECVTTTTEAAARIYFENMRKATPCRGMKIIGIDPETGEVLDFINW